MVQSEMTARYWQFLLSLLTVPSFLFQFMPLLLLLDLILPSSTISQNSPQKSWEMRAGRNLKRPLMYLPFSLIVWALQKGHRYRELKLMFVWLGYSVMKKVLFFLFALWISLWIRAVRENYVFLKGRKTYSQIKPTVQCSSWGR